MGQSSIPTKKSEYTTTNMAKDALAVMDHLGWRKAHVFGHSMGSMIACKLAAIVGTDTVIGISNCDWWRFRIFSKGQEIGRTSKIGRGNFEAKQEATTEDRGCWSQVGSVQVV